MMENKIDIVAQVLSKVQAELEVPKDQVNDFGGFKYRTAEQILGAIKPIAQKHGATLWLSDDVVVKDGRHYVEATAYFCAGGQLITSKANARETESKKGMDVAQITGAASSYARKYALGALFNIDDSNDPDTKDNSKHEAEPLFKTEMTVAAPLFDNAVPAIPGVESAVPPVAPVTPDPVKVEVTAIAPEENTVMPPATPALAQALTANAANAVANINEPGAFVAQQDQQTQAPAEVSPKNIKDQLQEILIANNALVQFKNWLQVNGHITVNQEWCDAPINVFERALQNPQKFLQVIGGAA